MYPTRFTVDMVDVVKELTRFNRKHYIGSATFII